MAQARPRIVSRLREHAEAVAAAEAALDESLVMLPLVNSPETEGTHELHIYLLGAGRPMVVLAEIAGIETDSLFPLALRPLEGDGIARIRAFLNDIGQRALRSSAPPPSSRAPAPIKIPTGDALPVVTATSRRAGSSWGASPAPASGAPPSSASGLIGGKYTLGQPLRAGASVYAAIQSGLEKKLAVKVMRPSAPLQPDVVTTFQRVALAASELDHPNVARVVDFGHERAAPLYVAMDLLSGTELRTVLREESVLPLARIVAIASQVCAALSAAHERGVVHRDLKPANVFLLPTTDDDGHPTELVKVADFAIAEIVASLRFLDPSFDPIMATGTPQYMAPEVVRGERPTPKSDIYSCGVMLYEMATGRLPFPAPSNAAEMLRLQGNPPAPSAVMPSIDRNLERLIERAMSKDPSARHETARDLRSDLRALLGGPRSSPSVAPSIASRAVAAPASRWARSPAAASPAPPPVSSPPLSSPPVASAPSRPPSHAPSGLADAEGAEPALGTAAAARAARLARQEDEFEIPMSTRASERSDALDIDFGSLPHSPKSAHGIEDVRNQPAWVALELMTSSLRSDPESVLAPFDKLVDLKEYANEMQRLDKPIATLASRGEATALRRVIGALQRRAGGSQPNETTKAGLAALRIGLLANQREALMPIARTAIDGPDNERGAAFAIVVACGAAGAHAACAARKRPPEPAPEDRARFAAMIRDIGAAGVGPVSDALKAAGANDQVFVEDALEALALINGGAGLPPSSDLGPSAVLADFFARDPASVRKRAALAFASVLGARSHARLIPLLKSESDEGVRVAIVEALRKTRGITRDAILQLDGFLNGAAPVGNELKTAAAAALGDADAVARPQAAGVLARAIKPPQQGLLNKLVGSEADDPLLVTTIAKSLLAVGGADAAALVESRASKSSGEVKQKLLELVQKRT